MASVLLLIPLLMGCGGRYTAGPEVNNSNKVIVETDLFVDLISNVYLQHPETMTMVGELEWRLRDNPRTGNAEWAMLFWLQARYFWHGGNTSAAMEAISKSFGFLQQTEAAFVKLPVNSRARAPIDIHHPMGREPRQPVDVVRNDAQLIADAFRWARTGFAEIPLGLVDQLQRRGDIPVLENSPLSNSEMGPFYAVITQDTGLPVYEWRELGTNHGSYYLTLETVLLDFALVAIADFESAYRPPWENQDLVTIAASFDKWRRVSEDGRILLATVGILTGRRNQVSDFTRQILEGTSSTTQTLFGTIMTNGLRI